MHIDNRRGALFQFAGSAVVAQAGARAANVRRQRGRSRAGVGRLERNEATRNGSGSSGESPPQRATPPRFASRGSISGRYGSNLLLPGPFGRPRGRPAAFLAPSASVVLARIRSRSISASMEKAMAMILLWIVPSGHQAPSYDRNQKKERFTVPSPHPGLEFC